MTPPSRRDDPPNPFARHNPWGAPGPGVIRVGPPPASAPPKAAPARPPVASRPITAPALGPRAGVLTGSAVPPPLPRAQAPRTQAPQAQPSQAQAPAAHAATPAPAPAPAAEPARTPAAPQPVAAAPPRAAERDWKSRLKTRAPILAGVAYVVLVAASAVFLLPMRPEHDSGPEAKPAAQTPSLARATATTATEPPIRAAMATMEPTPVAASAPEPRREAQAPRLERRAVRLAAASPPPAPASPPEPEVQPLIVAQNATPVVPPPLPERAPTVPPPTEDPDAPMVTRLPEMR